MIRWSRVLMILTPAALIWAGAHFFLDRGIERAIESTGSALNGARVDVRSVSTSFWRLSASVRGLEVADPDHPMRNTVQADLMRLQLELKPLFWRRFIIKRAEILGIRTGATRRVSGALPKKAAPSEPEKPPALAQWSREAGAFALGNLKEAYDPKKLVTPEALASYKKVQEEKDRLDSLSTEWKSKAETLDLKGLSSRSKGFVEKVKSERFSGMEGIAKAQALLKEGAELQRDLKAASKTLKEARTSLSGEIGRARSTLKDIDRLRREDIDRAVGQVKSGFSTEGVTRALLGSQWADRLETGLTWLRKAQGLAPASSKEKKPDPPAAAKRRGRDIPFPFHHAWPTFHLKRAALSASIGESEPLACEGSLTDVSSDPPLVGKPIVLDLAGRRKERSLEVNAKLDLTGEKIGQDLRVDYRGFGLSDVKLGDLKGPVVVADGRGSVTADLTTRGTALSGNVDVSGDSLRIVHRTTDAQPDRWVALVSRTLEKVSKATVAIELGGTLTAPRVGLSTSLDDDLKTAMKGAFDEEIARLRADAEKRVAELVDAEISKLRERVDRGAADALEKLNLREKDLGGVEETVNKTLDDLARRGSGGLKIPDMKNLFKKR